MLNVSQPKALQATVGICDGGASKLVTLVPKLIYFLLTKLTTNVQQRWVSR
jgi:hypothetical protein